MDDIKVWTKYANDREGHFEGDDSKDKFERQARAILASLADPDHIFWNAGTPGLSPNPLDRWPLQLREQMVTNLATVLKNA